ncbi:hypothetical protein FACS1894120_2250 [Clostridia bacterium]|nr:hypothetical protein FACS1894120_2250 [Clostridia bacterium]
MKKSSKSNQPFYQRFNRWKENGGGKLIVRILAGVLALVILLTVVETGKFGL